MPQTSDNDKSLAEFVKLFEQAIASERERCLRIIRNTNRQLIKEEGRFSTNCPEKQMYSYASRLLDRVYDQIENPEQKKGKKTNG